MRKIFILVLCLAVFFSACKKDAATTDFDKSYANWLSFKKSQNNSYSFTAVTDSWVLFDTETKITVVNGAITARDFVAYQYHQSQGADTLTKVTVDQWHEDKTNLNSHTDSQWLLTLEDVYAKAKADWLSMDAHKNTIYFETKNNGMISTAGYYPNGCQDDCFTGISISSISPL